MIDERREPGRSAAAGPTRRPAWPAGPLDATMEVPCDGRVHRIRWHRGRLELVDHPDPDAEVVLAAFGADLPTCLELRDLWRAAIADGGFGAEWAQRELYDVTRQNRIETALLRLQREGVQDLLPELSSRRAARMGEVLARFSHELVDRAALGVAVRALRRDDLARHELAPWLAHATRVRLRSAFVASLAAWRHRVRTAPLVRLRGRVGIGIAPAAEGCLAGKASWCDLVVDLSWLVDVWGRGLATVDGDLVLAVEPAQRRGPERLAVLTWAADGGPATPLRPSLRWRTRP